MREPQGVASLALGYVLHWAFSPPLLNPKLQLYYKDTGLLVASLDEESQYDMRVKKNYGSAGFGVLIHTKSRRTSIVLEMKALFVIHQQGGSSSSCCPNS